MTLKKIYPTDFQKSVMWWALTLAAMLAIVVLTILTGYALTKTISFLQPVLVPVVTAAIISFLLHPVVCWFEDQFRWTRKRATALIVSLFVVFSILLAVMVLVPTFGQAKSMFEDREKLISSATKGAQTVYYWFFEKISVTVGAEGAAWFDQLDDQALAWVKNEAPNLMQRAFQLMSGGVVGIVSFLGYFIGFVLLPLYLWYFLHKYRTIRKHWSDFLPLRESRFKQELVETLKEMNGYLIAFFRGQLIVSMIDGVLIGGMLAVMGLKYALLIGVLVALLGVIPFIGMLVCAIPAILISIAQFYDPTHRWSFLPELWPYPLIVAGIFIVANQLEGWFIAPKIVGESTGLHPLTVIFSVFFWSLLLGGFLGALLAVPLTAAIKVLFVRYLWPKIPGPGHDHDDDAIWEDKK